ncbi:MAG TPA: SRPBCC family protein [Chthoniobacterales bacterium]|nr:SRPBCC family protein [Chthoniobacterales bacterium]
MPVIELTTTIRAPIERTFDLARSLDLHMISTAHTGERAVAGVTTGLLGLGQEVTWRARHFGIWQHLTSRITAFERPVHFRDSMVRGAFRRFFHDHFFTQDGNFTIMRDVFDFRSPLGILGHMADRLFLTGYMRSLLQTRNSTIKAVAESDQWQRYLPEC